MNECVTKFKTCAEQKHSFLFNKWRNNFKISNYNYNQKLNIKSINEENFEYWVWFFLLKFRFHVKNWKHKNKL